MFSYRYFLVSSPRHEEKNALSEAYWLLSEFFQIKNLSALLLSIPGLGLLKILNGNNHHIPLFNTNIFSDMKDPIKYCHKIIPLENYCLYSEESLKMWVEGLNKHITSNDTWRLTIKKRQSQVKSNKLIRNLATLIYLGKVDLTNPKFIIQIEILGKNMAYGLITPNHFLSFQLID